MRPFLLSFLCFALAGLPGAVHATILAGENFDYPAGALTAVSGGMWTTHSGTAGQVRVADGRVLISQTNTEDVAISLAGQSFGTASPASLYASFYVRFVSLPTGAGEYFAHWKGAGTSGFVGKVFATTNGAAPGAFRLGISKSANAPSAVLPTDLSLNTEYRVVTRYVPANYGTTLWLDPLSEADASISATDAGSAATVLSLALREAFSSPNGMGTVYVREVIAATSFAELSPDRLAPAFVALPPAFQTAEWGSNVTLTAEATGAPPLNYQWQLNGEQLPDYTNATLFLPSVTTNSSGSYVLTVSNRFGVTNSPTAVLQVVASLPVFTRQPADLEVNEGSAAFFQAEAESTTPLQYQWQLFGTNLPGETQAVLSLPHAALASAGPYRVEVRNYGGATNSRIAMLSVLPAPEVPATFSVMTYNVKGNGATDWSTNSEQVRAVARQIHYLNPDIITFNEIPYQQAWQMTNFMAAFLPGFHLATNSGTDGFIRSMIASRYPIVWSKSWLDGASLTNFGYSGRFTRDLFQAQVQITSFPQPLDVFVTHLKATTSSPMEDALKRGAEAAAISNLLVTTLLPTNRLHLYVLCGDLNEDIFRPDTNRYVSAQPIQTLTTGTGLLLTTPVNPFTQSDCTESIQSKLTVRFDYVLPCELLGSNITASQVFRTDLLTNPPPPLQTNDDVIASDHLPVIVSFRNPFARPFRLLSLQRQPGTIALTWESVPGGVYRIESSPALSAGSWSTLASGVTSVTYQTTIQTNVAGLTGFYRVVSGL